MGWGYHEESRVQTTPDFDSRILATLAMSGTGVVYYGITLDLE